MGEAVWQTLGRALSPVEERPRVASNLESASYHTRRGTPYVVIHNPRARTYARLDPREFELLSLMDGQRTVKELVIAYYQRNGVFALARVAGLVNLLRQHHLLAEPPLDAYGTLRARLRPALHQIRIGRDLTTSSIDTLFGRVYRVGGHLFFHSGWLYVGIATGIISPALVLFELARGRFGLYDVGGWGALTVVVLLVLTLLALAIHEIGHGLAVKHAGRRVNTAGLRLYFGLPTAFVDTTDIWMARPAHRLLTAFAGPWTGLVLGGSFAVGASVVGPGGLGTLLFTAAFVFLVDNLFNFNPLLELDGYYMLIDVLDRPLLRAQALAFVRGPLWLRLWRREPLSGDEPLLTAFGLAAIAYAALAAVLAIRAWEALLLPLIGGNLTSGDLPRELFGLLILLAVVIPVGVVALGIVRGGVEPIRGGLGWLSGRAAEHRHAEALAVLRAVRLWSELPTRRLLELARVMRAQAVPTGTEVIRQGDPGDEFYLIARGGFEVRIDEVAQVHLGRGDFFGERALLNRAQRAATVVATEAGAVFVLKRADFDALLASDLAARARIEAALAYREEVAAMPMFRDLSSGELDALLSRFEVVSLATGEVVIREGEPGDRFYVLRSGSVTVQRRGQTVANLGPGDAFGEIALLLAVPRTATVTATRPTTLLSLEQQDFRDVLASYLGRGSELERLSHLRLLSHKRLDEVV